MDAQGVSIEVLRKDGSNRAAQLVRQFHSLCESVFHPSELEPANVWLRGCAGQEAQNIEWALVVVTRQEEVVAGGVLEVYAESGAGLIAYLATSRAWRGKGYARACVGRCVELTREVSRECGTQPLGTFAEVQRQGGGASTMDPTTRIHIWQGLGFLGIPIDWRLPSTMGEHTYRFAVHGCTQLDPTGFSSFLSQVYNYTMEDLQEQGTQRTKEDDDRLQGMLDEITRFPDGIPCSAGALE